MSKNGLILLKPTSISYSGTSATNSSRGLVEFTACTSVSLNGVFSANYINYMVVAHHTGSTAATLKGRLRSAGVDATASNYNQQFYEFYNTTKNAGRNNNQADMNFGPIGSGYRAGHVIWIYGPFLSQPTALRNISTGPWSAAFPGYIVDETNTHSLSTSYDGITFFPAAGSMTGNVAIYGMRN